MMLISAKLTKMFASLACATFIFSQAALGNNAPGLFAQQENAHASTADQQASALQQAQSNGLKYEMEQAQLKKLDFEIRKLNTEISSLETVGPKGYRFVSIMTAIGALAGGLMGALIAGSVAFIGHQINRNYNHVQSEKLQQDRILSREKHNLELFQGLGSANPRAQFAAAAVLPRRLEALPFPFEKVSGKARSISPEDRDATTIIHVLISILKEQGTDEAPSTIRKHVADNLVKSLGLVKWNGHAEHDNAPSLLSNFDLQKCQLRNVFWRGVNIRNVDLYGADLSEASFRCADLRQAVLYGASLKNSVFRNARLNGSNLEGADVSGADFRDAVLVAVNLKGAKFDERTRWPEGFEPLQSGAVFVGGSNST